MKIPHKTYLKILSAVFLAAVFTVTLINSAAANSPSDYVRITTTGSSFSPVIELKSHSEATITWTVEGSGDSYTGLSPTIQFGSTGTRYIKMTALNNDGTNALSDIVTFNIGFNYTQDAGKYNIGSSYNHSAQSVSGLEYVNNMTGLIRFLAATPSLIGELDFSGLGELQYIECYGAAVSSVELSGCMSLIRLCLEWDDLSYLDLNPVSDCLYDLRMSGNRDTVTFEPLDSPMKNLYHYCVHSETVINHPTAEQLPVVEELWDWDSEQSGQLLIRSSALQSVLTYENDWTSADLTDQFPADVYGKFDAHSCLLTSVTLDGCNGLAYIDLHDNQLGQTDIDGILEQVASWETYSGTLDLSANTAPSTSGQAYVAILENRGWSVTTDTESDWYSPYSDVAADVWYYDAVCFVTENNLMNGIGSNVFSPYSSMTRAMFVTVLYRMSGDSGDYANTFSDVPENVWYESAVSWANANGIAPFIAGNYFEPDLMVSREQIAVMLYNYSVYLGQDVSVSDTANISSYEDVNDISDYAYTALQWACATGIINGDDNGYLNPTDSATRAEVAVMLQRYAEAQSQFLS